MALVTPPDPRAVSRFRRCFEALAGELAEPDRIGIAVSGGPDSLALLMLANAAYPGHVEAATVDHRVRAANADEATMVKATCERLGLDHATLLVNDPLPSNPNQAWARSLRYGLLERWVAKRGLAFLLTAHHADDQAETLLMRANRGSGVTGLAAIRPSSSMVMSDARLLRPLLDWKRSELRTVIDETAISAVDDPSNRSFAFDRTAARALLAQEAWLKPDRLAATARHAAAADAALEWSVDRLWRERLTEPGSPDAISFDVAELPTEFRRRLIVRALHEVRGVAIGLDDGWQPRGSSIDRLLRRAVAERSVTGWSATLGGVQVTVYCETWHFRAARARRSTRPSI